MYGVIRLRKREDGRFRSTRDGKARGDRSGAGRRGLEENASNLGGIADTGGTAGDESATIAATSAESGEGGVSEVIARKIEASSRMESVFQSLMDFFPTARSILIR